MICLVEKAVSLKLYERLKSEYDQVTCIFMQISDERIIKEHSFAPVNVFR